MEKKILCVIRTSTDSQEIESQREDMKEFLTSSGLNFSEEEIEWIEAKGASARKVTDKYLNMLESIKATISSNPSIKSCAFWHLNRLGRWENYIVDMKTWFINNHIQVYVKTPNLTLLKEDGSLDNGANIAWGVFASMVSYDTMELMEKTSRGKKAKAEKGLYNGGGIPYGFKVVNDRVVEDPSTIGNVKTIFEEYSSGNYSCKKLEQELKSRGLNFADYLIGKFLRRELYKPIVGEEVWNKCQEVLEGNKWTTKQSRNDYISLKVVKCSVCGGNCICARGKYVCYKKYNGFRFTNPCTNKLNIKGSVIDQILFDLAYEMEYESLKISPDTSELENKLNIITLKINQTYKEIDKLVEKQKRLQDAYLEVIIDKNSYDKRKSKLIKESVNYNALLIRQNSERDLIEEQIRLMKNPDIKSISEYLLEEELTETYKRTLIKKYILKCTPSNMIINGNYYTRIDIETKKGDSLSFYYFSHHKGKCDSDNLFTLNQKTGKMESYLYPFDSSKYKDRYEMIKDKIKTNLKNT